MAVHLETPTFSVMAYVGFGLLLMLLSCMRCITCQHSSIQLYNCTDPSNSSKYVANRDLLLSSLSSNVTSATGGFYNASIGDGSDQAYGLFLCRGDINTTDCQNCVDTGVKAVQALCPNMTTAIIWYDDCMVRYTNQSISSKLEEEPVFYPLGPRDIINLEQYNQTVADLMHELVKEAVYDSTTPKYFAAGEVEYYTGYDTVYGLVQCTPDITQDECNGCLNRSINDIPRIMYPKEGGRALKPSCNLRFEFNSAFFNQQASPPFASPPSTNSAAGRHRKGRHSIRTVIVVVAVLFPMIIMIIAIFCGCFRRRKQKLKSEEDDQNKITNADIIQFKFKTIRAATDNFSATNKLGQGGFGAVYKGKLLDGQLVAVKRLSRNSNHGDIEFKNEVLLVAKLQHRNLVRLLGFCLKGEERLLIYEFVPNKSLDHFIFDPIKRSQMDWADHYKIIGGIARGLLYLHEDSRLKIIHRDVKASNILLDEEMNPKIADFGLARLFAFDQTEGSTSTIVGTYGYMAPEIIQGHISIKTDVFSFGVLVLEIVTGQRNRSFNQSETFEGLLSYAWRNWMEGTPLQLLHPSLRENCPSSEVIKCVHIGLLCVQGNVSNRPTMASVVLMLNGNSTTLPLPSLPAFVLEPQIELVETSTGNQMSISQMSARS